MHRLFLALALFLGSLPVWATRDRRFDAPSQDARRLIFVDHEAIRDQSAVQSHSKESSPAKQKSILQLLQDSEQHLLKSQSRHEHWYDSLQQRGHERENKQLYKHEHQHQNLPVNEATTSTHIHRFGDDNHHPIEQNFGVPQANPFQGLPSGQRQALGDITHHVSGPVADPVADHVLLLRPQNPVSRMRSSGSSHSSRGQSPRGQSSREQSSRGRNSPGQRALSRGSQDQISRGRSPSEETLPENIPPGQSLHEQHTNNRQETSRHEGLQSMPSFTDWVPDQRPL